MKPSELFKKPINITQGYNTSLYRNMDKDCVIAYKLLYFDKIKIGMVVLLKTPSGIKAYLIYHTKKGQNHAGEISDFLCIHIFNADFDYKILRKKEVKKYVAEVVAKEL